ncbi:hypothetical protein ERO13_D08G114308v2 [Gossypium hirsutum]|uniref:Uncharacterized protein n=1 Tax=Gossypium barbadense TaxID=3634 RepID=A0A5J5QD43_GOSBA|nr:hypothetical protein ES319_D08G117700v1 [Gossypium barbadense]KAG4133695.1 hypothetical protein ERO13_D08G114308v2 [Gossypium hirsutum]
MRIGPAANKKPVTDQQYQKHRLLCWRSMGFLQSPRSMNQNSKNYISGIVKRRNLSEFDMSKLGIGFDDEKSERKTSEKALVLSQINV